MNGNMLGPLEIGGAVAIAFAAIRLGEAGLKAAVALAKRRNGSGASNFSPEVQELKQVNASLVKISETLVVMRVEGKQTLTKVSDNANKLDIIKGRTGWLKQNEEFKSGKTRQEEDDGR